MPESRVTQITQQVLADNASSARVTQITQQLLKTDASSARVTQITQQILVSRAQKLAPRVMLVWGNTNLP